MIFPVFFLTLHTTVSILDDSDDFTQLSLFSDESLRNYSPDNDDWYCLNL